MNDNDYGRMHLLFSMQNLVRFSHFSHSYNSEWT